MHNIDADGACHMHLINMVHLYISLANGAFKVHDLFNSSKMRGNWSK